MRFVLVLCLFASTPALAELPLFFVPTGPGFVAQTPGLAAAFTRDSIWLQTGGERIQMRFRGALDTVRVEGTEPLASRANFLTGSDPAQWRRDLPTYGGVLYRGVWTGIDAAYAGSGHALKSEFRVAPGADPQDIRWEYPGASTRITPGGSLSVRAGEIELRDTAPEVFTESPGGKRTPVEARYRIFDDGSAGFELGVYDTSLPLIIDPVISYSTFLGGSGMGAVTAVALDGLGNLYAAGWTESIDFPIAGAMQAVNRGGVDAFVVKLDPTGASLLYATYIGGNGDDRAAGIAVDTSGQAHVAGGTGSSNFPLQTPARSLFSGGKEAFALKLNAAGSVLAYSTYLGGTNHEVATAIAVDGAGFAYVAGDTLSANFGVLNAVQASLGGQSDAFVTKLDPAGAIAFSTFLGGSLAEHAGGIATDGAGNVYLAGGTLSTNFPVTGAIQALNAGGQDAFVAKLKTSAPVQILYSTYLGGSGGSLSAPEQANAIAIDAAGNAHIAGVVSSANFPVTVGTLQTNAGGSRDIFVTKLNASGTARLYSTYLGWTGFDWPSGIALDTAGNAYITGYTSSVSFANIGGVQSGFNGLYDAFISKISAAGNTLSFSTLYGGAGSDQGTAIAVDPNGNIFVGGQTSSSNFPLQAALQTTNVSGNTGWVARLGVTAPPSQVPAAVNADLVYGSGGAATITAQFSHPGGAATLTSVAVLLSRTASVDFACHISFNPASNQLMLANNVVASGGTPVTPGSGGAQNTQCTLNGAGSGAVVAGNTLTLTLSVVLDAGFPGNNTVYLYAADVNSNTGWVAKSAASVVTADSVSPGSASGASQTFTFVFSDTKNAANVQTAAMLINSTLSGINACWMVFDRARGSISLLYDTGAGSNAKPFGSNANIQNNQCALGAPSISVSGTSTILTVPISFYGAFTGPKNIYMLALGPNNNTGWVQRGTYNVIAGGVPVAASVSPAAGSGSDQSFSFTISDQGGSNFLWAAAMLFSRTSNFDLDNGCYVVWDKTTSRFSLFKDLFANGTNSFVVGSGSVAGNSQCILHDTGSSVTFGATTITITIHLTFSAAFAGAKNSFLFASEPGYNSGWALVGNWTVPGTAPTVGTLSPTSGTGLTQTFVATVSTAVSPSDISGAGIQVTAAGNANACSTVYDRAQGTIGLYNNAATSLATKPLGSSAALQNTQCAIGFSSASISGNTLTLTVQIVFKSPAFAGAKQVYVQGTNAWGSSGLVQKGTWGVP